ncbi:MAG: lactate utilization protein C [Actinobacteria bacterium]|nr:lactate utilization protein C [Actinomycetota bacterium]
MSARDDVLARVRRALATDEPSIGDVPRTYRQRGDRPPGDPALIDLFVERLTDYRAHARRTTTDDVAGHVARAISEGLDQPGRDRHAPPRIVVPSGLPTNWLSATDADVIPDAGLTVDELDACDGVVTAASVAIAETGTIVLDGESDQGRRAISLVPDLHVCVVRTDQIVETVPEGVARLDPGRPLTWISGPSATSDIELDRVEGVHGPRTLHVVLLDG